MSRPLALIVDPDAARRDAVVAELRGAVGEDVAVLTATSSAGAVAAVEGATDRLALVVAAARLEDGPGADLLDRLHRRWPEARKLLVTDAEALTGLSGPVDHGAVHGIVAVPWTPGAFGRHLRTQLLRGFEVTPAGRRPELLPAGSAHHGVLGHLDLAEDELERRTLAAFDRVLGHRPRIHLDAGTELIREDETVNGLWLVLEGHVALTHRDDPTVVHHRSTGPILGLLSLTQHRRAFLTCTARTDVVAVHLTVEQLEQALESSEELPPLFLAVLLRSLAGRLRRSQTLHLQVADLHRQAAADRDRLAETLAQLEAAETQLIEAARMATLGELAAGLAHELNNPVAALQRTAEHLLADARTLLPDDAVAVFDAATREPARSSADTRALRRRLQELAGGDRELADRLLAAGIVDAGAARAVLALPADARDRRLTALAGAHRLATGLRNIDSAAQRVAGLVASLKAYAREGAPEGGVDVVEGLEDTLRILGHRLARVTVERHYEPVPTVAGDPGELNQVWTNLIANALDAMEDEGHLVVATDQPDAGHVRVTLEDSGPGLSGVAPERLFEPRFTTKAGRVAFGLGLGLAITRQIVVAHGGRVALADRSDASGTVATVILPVAPASLPATPASPPATPASPPATPASPPATPASPPATPASPPRDPASDRQENP